MDSLLPRPHHSHCFFCYLSTTKELRWSTEEKKTCAVHPLIPNSDRCTVWTEQRGRFQEWEGSCPLTCLNCPEWVLNLLNLDSSLWRNSLMDCISWMFLCWKFSGIKYDPWQDFGLHLGEGKIKERRNLILLHVIKRYTWSGYSFL